MDKSFFGAPIHIKVFMVGKCKRCNNVEKKQIYDYGKLPYREVEQKMDEVVHQIFPIPCSKCGEAILPSSLTYYDELRKETIQTIGIQYNVGIPPEEYEKMQEGHRKRHEIFREHEEEFWEEFLSYGVEHFSKIIQELKKDELIQGLIAVGEPVDKEQTEGKLRKQVIIRITEPNKQKAFLKAANREIVYDHLLDLGPLAWVPEIDIQKIGELRTRFFVLHLPLDEALEPLRTKWIGKVIRKGKGDNEFLFQRIHQLTEENERLKEKITRYVHSIEELKIQIKERDEKLNRAYEKIRLLEESGEKIYERDPRDIRKIQELKSFIRELIEELKSRPLDEKDEEPEIKEAQDAGIEIEQTEAIDLSALAGKIIGIIGGERGRQARELQYPFSILTHNGEENDEDFYRVLNESDILVILTRFVSHIAMWEAKAYAIGEGKPIFFERNINIPIILMNIAGKLRD
ncbi:DUF2325 domain-containing protein [Thermicanus aegyptius]|uniref:DUF2325 domain-containing protein n=1 Tax=Thermicanus aegyptius TaxID=94009 RepID=UPI00048FF30F|nr:DUF2325 domain-containing protein [Thermicanus aegyptius]